MRQFYLVNNVGTTYFLDHRTNTLIAGIDNIGYEKENIYLTYENSLKKVDERIIQTTITFSLIFLEGYKGYAKFLDFIKKSNIELRLFYKYSNEETRYMIVSFKSITKTELQSNTIQSTLCLEKMSLWLNKTNYIINVNESSNGKVFPFPYPFIYSASFNGEITVVNNGEYKAPLYIGIIGEVKNPMIEIIKDAEVISKMRLLVTSSKCEIAVNSEETNQYMQMTENNVTKNIYANQDFTCDNFLFLEKGTYTIKFDPGVSAATVCKITMLERYGGY